MGQSESSVDKWEVGRALVATLGGPCHSREVSLLPSADFVHYSMLLLALQLMTCLGQACSMDMGLPAQTCMQAEGGARELVPRLRRVLEILLVTGRPLAELDLDTRAPLEHDFRCFFLEQAAS